MPFDSRKFGGFFSDLKRDGYHIFSRKLNREAFYPNQFAEFPEVNIRTLKEGERITVRAFFPSDKSKARNVESGEIDLELEYVADETTVWGNIMTEFPPRFPLAKGTSIEIHIDEVLRVRTE